MLSGKPRLLEEIEKKIISKFQQKNFSRGNSHCAAQSIGESGHQNGSDAQAMKYETANDGM